MKNIKDFEEVTNESDVNEANSASFPKEYKKLDQHMADFLETVYMKNPALVMDYIGKLQRTLKDLTDELYED